MICKLPELLAAIRRTLHDAVAPELTSDHARGQLASIADILAKLEGMTIWAPAALEAQRLALQDGCTQFIARATLEGFALARSSTAASAPIGVAANADTDAEQALAAQQAEARRLMDWLFDPPPELPEAAHRELAHIMQQALAQQLLIERRRVPLTDFTAMTGSRRPAASPATGSPDTSPKDTP